MRYKLLGKSGLRVSELCLGTMTFGEDWGWGSSQEESRRVYDTFLEAGGNFIDTANVYTRSLSEFPHAHHSPTGLMCAGRGRKRTILGAVFPTP